MSRARLVSVRGIGAWGPGFSDWPGLCALLRGGAPDSVEVETPKPELIPARERRRAPLSVKLAVETASQACAAAGVAPVDAASVFASGMGDTSITDYMCRTLASQPALISPTRFHNSVHNAAAGYWSISTGCHQASNSVAGFELSVGMSLMEAAAQCALDRRPVLVMNVDIPTAFPMRDIHRIDAPFAGACLLCPVEPGREGAISFKVLQEPCTWPDLKGPSLTDLYHRNPAARLLALFAWVDQGSDKPLRLPLSEGTCLQLECAS